ncbi:Protein cbp-1 [Orchesella cincta]|uniref:Protein cbp-1 n=1 Tax=Orchesella cincta TaxID=48709 RepID=A0A1D2NFD8_ORCCI|nr:Protein cbp-1 [Orchesella cincta]
MIPPDFPQIQEMDAAVGVSSLPISPVYNENSDTIMWNMLSLIRHEKTRVNQQQAQQQGGVNGPDNVVNVEFCNQHVVKCEDPNCTVAHCRISRDLFKHWMACEQKVCHICSPGVELTCEQFISHLMKRGVYPAYAGEINKLKTNLPAMKQMVWTYL